MTLEEALRVCEAQGLSPRVQTTCAPRTERTGGTLRVIRVRGEELTVSAFLDGDPVE